MTDDRISIKDVAQAAGVSHPTVSRALNDSPLVNEQTRARIKRLATEMGYIPDAVARSLQKRRTHIIGLVVTSIGDPFFADLVRGVEEAARQSGFSTFLNSSHNDSEQEIQVIETLHRQRVDGIVVASSRIGENHIERLARINVPVVLVNNQAPGDNDFLHSIAVDNHGGARNAVDHLIDLGHERIGYIGVNNRPRSNAQRLDGYRRAMDAAGLTISLDWIHICRLDPQLEESDVVAGKEAAAAVLKHGVTALFCYNDMLAIGALLACREAGATVPEHVSVVGFDDIEMARFFRPSLTTVAQPKREMGRMAIQAIVDLLDNQIVANRLIEPEVIRRESTSSPGG